MQNLGFLLVGVDQDVDQSDVFYWSMVDVRLMFSSHPILGFKENLKTIWCLHCNYQHFVHDILNNEKGKGNIVCSQLKYKYKQLVFKLKDIKEMFKYVGSGHLIDNCNFI